MLVAWSFFGALADLLSTAAVGLDESSAFGYNSSGVYICKSVVNDLKHGKYICKSEEVFYLL